jgi:murein L,D-transpeptidase YcbB/YkuD
MRTGTFIGCILTILVTGGTLAAQSDPILNCRKRASIFSNVAMADTSAERRGRLYNGNDIILWIARLSSSHTVTGFCEASPQTRRILRLGTDQEDINRISQITPVDVGRVCQREARARFRPGKAPLAATEEYQRTLDALDRYRVLAAEDDGELLPETEEPVQPGDRYDGVQRLIRLLRRLGDLPVAAVFDDPGLYDGALVTAVQRLQIRHGLDPTGRIDKTTLAQLNTPLAFRVRQLELAAERWRRNPYDPRRRVIVLNLPEFRLRAFRAGQLELEMKIVVGQADEHKTPLLSSELAAIIFRPYWEVPLRIQRDEIVPALEQDPSYLSDHDLELVTPRGIVAPDELSDGMLARLRTGLFRLRQAPGPKNSLGLAKFVFPNQHDVYMHDTPVRSVFYRPRRDLSHGCIRVEKAGDLAEWVLRDQAGWSRDRIDKVMQGSESMTVKLTHPIQVVTMYATAMVLENGEVRFFDDIYGEDEALEGELSGAMARANPSFPRALSRSRR